MDYLDFNEKQTVDYKFSKSTFPVNNKVAQHSDFLNKDDQYFECALLAGKILGVRCNDSHVFDGFQIAPYHHSFENSEEEAKEYNAFNNYFYKNYGKHDDHCYFDTIYEAFFNLVKAWQVWKEILSNEEKSKYMANL